MINFADTKNTAAATLPIRAHYMENTPCGVKPYRSNLHDDPLS